VCNAKLCLPFYNFMLFIILLCSIPLFAMTVLTFGAGDELLIFALL